MSKYTNFETLQVHAGHSADKTHGSCVTPIHQTTSFVFESVEHGAKLFSLEAAGHIYTRLSNPTTDVLEQRFAQLEGGAAAICTSSGQAAIFYAIANVAEAGDNIIISDKLYGGSVTLFAYTMKRFGTKSGLVRIYDKFNRIENILNSEGKANFESAEDNLQDLATYAIMMLEYIKKGGEK